MTFAAQAQRSNAYVRLPLRRRMNLPNRRSVVVAARATSVTRALFR